ncbi:H4MPT-linked C1 transfer pathway protein [Methylobacterium organophilum]|uniref:hydantoinase/oxoprolinase family protein n=1 Tax=Methylobacterium organophilum TaxID=410 RepID=UPI001F12BF29|nr:hydantoinase/oxoprolinase family protein [Methylobacterium organophilum]UMY16910.1 H4MPT-linked C1 transfer pathway protein [Methylobacterium organophilum]
MSQHQVRTVGWDLGGVHVKAALIEGGRVRAARQAPCRLWHGLPALDETFAGLPDWARGEADHVVTMTGELTDCFADRADGVAQLAGWAAANLTGRVRLYAGRAGLVGPEAAGRHAADIASANWHATAALIGRHRPDALLVDIGSTTADLIPIAGGRPAATGYSDAERLETGELVYSGVVRTPLAALASHAPWNGRRVALMAEYFATTADIHRLTGDLPEGADQQHSPDLKGKSAAESETRLARMIGRDRGEGNAAQWAALAAFFAEAQLRPLQDAAATLLSRADLPEGAPLVVCGAGRFLAERIAARLGRRAEPLTGLIGAALGEADPAWVSTCGPAVAVGLVAAA